MTLRLALSITGEAAGARKAADETSRAVEAVGAAAGRAAAETGAASRAINQSLVGVSPRAEELRQRLQGVAVAARAADIAAYGDELDRLRARFNPLFAASKAYEAELEDLNRAHRVGAIGTQEHAAALTALNGRYQAMAAAQGVAGRSTQLTSFEMSNLAYQINDMGVMLASGQSPFVLLMQQGMQVSQIFSMRGMGLGASVRAFGTGLLAFVSNPLTLAVVGLAAAAGAAELFYNKVVSGGGDAADVLEDHEELLGRIREAYGDAGAAAADYRKESMLVLDFLRDQSLKDLREELSSEAGSLLSRSLDPGMLEGFFSPGSFLRASREVDQVREPLLDLIDAAERGGEGFEEARNKLVTFAQDPAVDAGIRAKVQEILNLTDRMSELSRAIDAAIPPSARSAQDFGMQELGRFENVQAVTLDRLRQQYQADAMGVAARSPAEKEAAAAARMRIQLLGQEMTAEERAARVAIAGSMARLQAEQALGDATRQRRRSLQASLEGARLENELVGQGIAAQERMRTELQLVQQAKEAAESAGTIVSEAEIEMIRQAAAELGRLAAERERLSLRSDLGFEREQLFRSPVEQRVADSMRGIYGDEYASQLGSTEAGMIRVNEQLSRGMDLTNDFASTLLSDLRNGASVVDALGNAFGRLSDQLVDMAFNAAINGVFSNLLGAIGGGAGGFSLPNPSARIGTIYHAGGIVGAGGAPTRTLPAALWDGAPRLHSGGFIRSDERPAILQTGELVLSRDQVRNGGMGGISVSVSAPVTIAGGAGGAPDAKAGERFGSALKREIEAMVLDVVARESRPRGLLAGGS